MPERSPWPEAWQALLIQQRVVEADPLFAVVPERDVESHPACVTCGVCCAVPGLRPLSAAELWAIVEYLDTDLETLRRHGLRRDIPNSLRSPCAFSRRDGDRWICQIYPVRPDVCRSFSQCAVLQDDGADADALIAAAQARWRVWIDLIPTVEAAPLLGRPREDS